MAVIPSALANPHDNPHIIAQTGAVAITASMRHIIRCTPSDANLALTVAAGISKRIQNEGIYAMTVAGIGTGTRTLQPGNEIELFWSAAQSSHEYQETKTAPTLESTVSVVSANGVQNHAITNYVNLVSGELLNLAAIRALTITLPERIRVSGHTAENDGGGGEFRLVAPDGTIGAGDRGDAGAGVIADPPTTATDYDDDGWFVVTSGGALYMRTAEECIPQHFGAFSGDTEASAAGMANQLDKMQRWAMFWSRPNLFRGWTQVPFEPKPRKFTAPRGFYHCNGTLRLDIETTFPLQAGYVPPRLEFIGAVFTPRTWNFPAVKIDGEVQAGKNDMFIRCVKQKAVDSRVVWNANPWPDKWRCDSPYRAWAASTVVYKEEYLKHVMGDGSTRLYEVTVGGTTHASTAPSHTNGTAVANGTATLHDRGTIRNTSGKSVSDMLHECQDIGVYVSTWRNGSMLGWETEGYTIASAMIPRSRVGAIGFNRFRCGTQWGCKFGYVLGSYLYEKEVADAAARLALTGLPKGAIVRQTNDATNDYVLNVLGGEATSGNWSTTTRAVAEAMWCNANFFETSLVYGRGPGGWLDTNKSVYGVGFITYGSVQGGPTGNTFDALDVEFPDMSGNAECVQVVNEAGSINSIFCRNDSPALFAAAHSIERSAVLHGDNNLATSESFGNYIRVARAGRRSLDPAIRLDRSNGREHVVDEIPGTAGWIKEYSVLNLFDDAVFSGKDYIYWKTAVAGQFGGPYDLSDKTTYDSGTDTGVRFHADTRSFSMGSSYGWAVEICLPENTTGDAIIEIEPILAAGGNFRPHFAVGDPAATSGYIDTSARPRHPIVFLAGVMVHTTSSGASWWRASANKTETLTFGVERWIKRILMRITGEKIIGFNVRLKNAMTGGVKAPAIAVPRGRAYAASRPKRGLFRAPAEFMLADQTGANKGFRLNKSPASEWWAVSGTVASLTSPSLWEWGDNGSGAVQEWNGSSWVTIASGVSMILDTDFVYYT